MTLFDLVIRNLRYYWRTNIAVVFGLAISAAVITGSLIIGDSIKESLHDMAVSRLGEVDYAMTSPGFFRKELASDLTRTYKLNMNTNHPTAITMVLGSVEGMDTDVVLPNVNVLGVDASFYAFYPNQEPAILSGRQALINETLAKDLGVNVGDSILVNLNKEQAAPAGTIFAHRAPDDTMQSLRLEVTGIALDQREGGFKLGTGTDIPRNVFVSLEWLASQMGKEGLANTLLISGRYRSDGNDTRMMQSILNKSCTLTDYGLKLISNSSLNYISLQSDNLLLNNQQVKAIQEAAAQSDAKTRLTSIYLASEIKNLRTSNSTAYSIVAAIQPELPFSFASGGSTKPDADHIWLNKWTADDLQAKVGDRLELSYLAPLPDGTYNTISKELTLSGIVNLAGYAADSTLVPTFKGMTDTESIESWNTPFPLDLSLVTERDDEYWKQYKTTPKVYIGMETAESIWKQSSSGSDAGWVTSVMISPETGSDLTSLRSRFDKALIAQLSPEDSGMIIKPVRQLAIQSAQGTTDFSQLFMAMSFFIMISGLGLAVMLLRLSTEKRASEIGMMLTCGFKPSTAILVISGEGFFLSLIGALLGLPIGIAYSSGIITALRNWWMSAVGTSFISVHIEMGSLMIGLISGLLAGVVSVILAALSLRKKGTLQLVCGWQSISVTHEQRSGKRSKIVLTACVVFSVILALTPLFTGSSMYQMVFFGMGIALLVGALAASNLILIRILKAKITAPSINRLALRSIAANRGRSLLVIGLLASAAFIIITVAASTRDFSRTDFTQKTSGTGGFALRAISTLPVHYDLNSPAGRAKLGFSQEDESAFENVEITSLMMSSGDDISCLNPTKTRYPIVLGVSDKLINRDGFGVQSGKPDANPWTLLDTPDGDAIPIFGDANSVIWNLHSGLGKDYIMPSADGNSINMRFAGLIPQSIFAGELLMYEKQFRKVFPSVSEPRYFLIDTHPGKEKIIAEALRRNLGRTGMYVKTTREILNSYMSVQNTYLSMFLVLGGLGVIFGVCGLVVVLLRSAFERRNEFAIMFAQGFKQSDIMRLLMYENIRLLISGLMLGTITALVSAIPALIGVESRINWIAILTLFGAIFVTGLASCLLAARKAVNGILINTLRGE
ncbi:MAG: ABC transporter permease [Armatimonadota bacterium]